MATTATELELAEPQSAAESQLEAWYMDDLPTDQRAPHRLNPNKPAPVSKLRELGVLSWKLDAANPESDPKLQAIRNIRGYSYQDVVTISPEKLPAYEDKLKTFFEEHIHLDEEIRFILEGSGYFDVRDPDDAWIRIACKPGDMIVLPEGIYHRFTLDESNYAKAMRLFKGEPVWTPYNRPVPEDNLSRTKYLQQFGSARLQPLQQAA